MYSALMGLAAVFLMAINPSRKEFIKTCQRIMVRMPRGHFNDLQCFLEGEDEWNEQMFWKRTKGLRGVVHRIRISLLCLELIQAFRNEKRIGEADSRVFVRKVIRQVIYSAFSIPEAVFCHIFKDSRHIAARESLRFYCSVLIRTENLCISEHTPECVLKLSELL